MIFYKLIGLIQIVLFVFNVEVSTSPGLQKSKEEHQSKVNQFYNYFQNDITKMHGGITYPNSTLQKFVDNINIVFKQLCDYYKSSFPLKSELTTLYKNSKKRSDFITIKIRLSYVQNVCLYIIRCVDYLFTSFPDVKTIVNMYDAHTNYCKLVVGFLSGYCTKKDESSNDEVQVSCQVDYLYEFYIDFLNFNSTEKSIDITRAYQDKAIDFIMFEHRLMSDFDWTAEFNIGNAKYEIYKNFPPSQTLRENKLLVWKSDKSNFEDFFKNKYNANISDIKKDIKKKLKNYNENYIIGINEKKECDPLTQQVEDEQRLSFVVSELLLYTFKRLPSSFVYELRKINNTSKTKNGKEMNELLSKVFENLCKYAPKIIQFLFDDSQIETQTINLLFSLYFSFCGNDMQFANKRCPANYECNKDKNIIVYNYTHRNMNDELEYNVKCVTESIIDKLLWNLYAITNEIPKEDKLTYKENCTILHNNYIKNIYLVLTTIYRDDDDKFKLWPMHDWISGKYLFTESFDTSGIDDIKYALINIEDKQFTLVDTYNYLLPFNTDMNSVFNFHSVVLHNLDEKMNSYIYIHAMTIIKYFARVEPKSINTSTIERFQQSFKWTESETYLKFKYYLNITTKRKTSDVLQRLINAIKNIRKDSTIANLEQIIPPNIFFKSLEFINENMYSHPYRVEGLNKIINDNCVEAMNFALDFISIARKSMKLKNEPIKNNSVIVDSHCKSLDKIFPQNVLYKVLSTCKTKSKWLWKIDI